MFNPPHLIVVSYLLPFVLAHPRLPNQIPIADWLLSGVIVALFVLVINRCNWTKKKGPPVGGP